MAKTKMSVRMYRKKLSVMNIGSTAKTAKVTSRSWKPLECSNAVKACFVCILFSFLTEETCGFDYEDDYEQGEGDGASPDASQEQGG